MDSIRLDCTQMTDREMAHDYLAQALSFPEWYGRNLDALYDLLTGYTAPLCLELLHPEALAALGDYGCALLDTLRDAASDNPQFTLRLL